MAIVRAWFRFGALPAFPVVVLFFVLAGAAALFLDETSAGVTGGVLFLVLVSYCAARPAQGWDVFAAAAAPNALGQLAHDFLGAPRWLHLALLPITLLWTWSIDHDGDPRDDARAGPGRPDAEPPGART